MGRLKKLPGWVVDNYTSVMQESEPYRQMTPEQRSHHLALACSAAASQLVSRADRDRALQYLDPLPESTVRALERLRREYRAKR